MPHPEQEHSLRIQLATARIQLATALRERDTANARADAAEARSNKLAVFLDEVYVLNRSLIRARDAADEALAAARRECERLRAALAKCGNISVPHSQMRPEKP